MIKNSLQKLEKNAGIKFNINFFIFDIYYAKIKMYNFSICL